MHRFLFFIIAFPVIVAGQVENGRKTVARLCSPEFHGRGYVNGGDSIAANYLIKAFQEIGCREFPQGISQNFSFPVNTFPNRMELNINGKKIEAGSAFVVAPNSCSGTETNANLIEIELNEILNRTVLQSKIDSLTRSSTETKNRIFLFSFYKYAGDTLKKARQLSKTLNERYTIVEVVDNKFTWSVEQDQSKFPRFEVQKSALEEIRKPLTISYAIDARMQNHTARNIISYIPAKRKSKKYIVFTAHYDHLGRMGQATYFPGGNDNASGTAMLVELARHYSKNRLKKTNVVFIAFAGEEVGLLGSQYYVEHPIFPLKNIQFLFNTDIMGSGEEGITIVNATLFPKQFDVLKAINTKQNYVSRIGVRGAAANSDHFPFSEKGVPAFFMYTQGPNKHYHDVFDTYEELSFNEFNDLFHLLIDFGNEISKK